MMNQAFCAFLVAAIAISSMATASVFSIPPAEFSKHGRNLLNLLAGIQNDESPQLLLQPDDQAPQRSRGLGGQKPPRAVAFLLNEEDVAQLLLRDDSLHRQRSDSFDSRDLAFGRADQKTPDVVKASEKLGGEDRVPPPTIIGNDVRRILPLLFTLGEKLQPQETPTIRSVPATGMMRKSMARAVAFARALAKPPMIVEESETLEQEVPQPIIGNITRKNVPSPPSIIEEFEEMSEVQKTPTISKGPTKITGPMLARAIAFARASLGKPDVVQQETKEDEIQPPSTTTKIIRKNGPSRPTVVKKDEESQTLEQEQMTPVIRKAPAKTSRSLGGADASELEELVQLLLAANL